MPCNPTALARAGLARRPGATRAAWRAWAWTLTLAALLLAAVLLAAAARAQATAADAAGAAAARTEVPAAAEPAASAAEAGAEDEGPWHEAMGYLGFLAFFPLAVVGVRWATQHHLVRLMNRASPERADLTLAELAADEVRAPVAPVFEMHDGDHPLPEAVQVREQFVAREMRLFRRAVLIDVVAGAVYVLLLLGIGLADRDPGVDMAVGLAIIGMVYPALAGLRYRMYRGQFRALDNRRRSLWRWLVPATAVLWLLRVLLSPKWQTVTALLWALLMLVLGVGWALADNATAVDRLLGWTLALAAVLHLVVAYAMLRRMQREPGVRLLVLRVFGIDANARFTFGRLLGFWRHFGHTFTVLDPSIWRHRYPLLSLRTLLFMAVVVLLGLLLLGWLLDLGLKTSAPWVTLALMSLLLAGYGALSYRLLRREFIRSRGQLRRVLQRLQAHPRNADLTFRSLEAMCHDDTWKVAVSEFAQQSEALLMDLRGFSEARKGCEYEVDYLLDVVPIERVVFLVDADGDHDLVRRLVLARWEYLRRTSPNLRPTPPQVQVYVSRTKDERDVQGILDLLIRAASLGRRDDAPPREVAAPGALRAAAA